MIDAPVEPLSTRSRRPAWFARTPEFELDCRDGRSTFRTVIKEAQRLLPGQIMAIRIGFEPTFLCRVLAGQGFNHWPEATVRGEWKIYFLRKHGDAERFRRGRA